MNYKIQQDGDKVTLQLQGRLDSQTAEDFLAFLAENVAEAEYLVLDCKKLSYVSSAGLRVLLIAQKQWDGNMTLTHISDAVKEVFELTGFSSVFKIG